MPKKDEGILSEKPGPDRQHTYQLSEEALNTLLHWAPRTVDHSSQLHLQSFIDLSDPSAPNGQNFTSAVLMKFNTEKESTFRASLSSLIAYQRRQQNAARAAQAADLNNEGAASNNHNQLHDVGDNNAQNLPQQHHLEIHHSDEDSPEANIGAATAAGQGRPERRADGRGSF